MRMKEGRRRADEEGRRSQGSILGALFSTFLWISLIGFANTKV